MYTTLTTIELIGDYLLWLIEDSLFKLIWTNIKKQSLHIKKDYIIQYERRIIKIHSYRIRVRIATIEGVTLITPYKLKKGLNNVLFYKFLS
jgi:hypothetical protein